MQSSQRITVQRLRQAALLAALLGEDGARRILQLLPASHSQLAQDVVGLIAAGEKRNGYFVEVGVGNGTDLSNTLLMERDYGWSGLLLEPNKSFHDKILRTRLAKLDGRAAFSSSGKRLQFVADSYLSHLADTTKTTANELREERYEVETVTLNEALEQAGAPKSLDFVSIDTEGSEVSVLDGFDLERWKVGMIFIEHAFDERRRRQYAEMLVPRGFVRVLDVASAFDDWYVHSSYAPDFLKQLGVWKSTPGNRLSVLG